jgi:hypothetical protein
MQDFFDVPSRFATDIPQSTITRLTLARPLDRQERSSKGRTGLGAAEPIERVR